jgi:hypothetical protein
MTHFLAKYPESRFATIWVVPDGDTPKAMAERAGLKSDQWAAFTMADWPGREKWPLAFELVVKPGGNTVNFNLEAAKECGANTARVMYPQSDLLPAQLEAIAAATTVEALNEAMAITAPA